MVVNRNVVQSSTHSNSAALNITVNITHSLYIVLKTVNKNKTNLKCNKPSRKNYICCKQFNVILSFLNFLVCDLYNTDYTAYIINFILLLIV